MRIIRRIAFCLSPILFALTLLFALNSAAYSQPPVTDGLIVHLDADSLAQKQDAGAAVASWSNLVGEDFAFEQANEQARPTLEKVGASFVVRFDGDDDHFRSINNGSHAAQDLTVFIVAAPHDNAGDYKGFVASNAPGGRDYETGFNIDLGPGPTRGLDVINVEGKGFGGAADLLEESYAFGTLHTFAMLAQADKKSVVLRVDGQATGERKFEPSTLALDELTLGGRFYTNGPGAQQVRCALNGDIVELLIYNRALSENEVSAVEAHLLEKHLKLAEAMMEESRSSEASVELVKVENPPAIQMLVPGFEIVELPVELTNINNVRFRSGGQLYTLGYDGDIHLLSDTDGDGVEDTAKLFWENEGSLRGPIGMLVTPQGYPHGQGVFTPSKGKLSLIVDIDGDDRADKEIIVATGWDEIPQNVDATGVTMDAEGYLYFGLGTANYANAYLVDEQGVAKYDILSDRGTVQRVSPDFSDRETVCTGVRFPIAFAFNAEGDLFCSEQEGATWLANGNPFDELLHIQPGRHYGFPPRHPLHNPKVIDEPSVYDYSPQHQSTCGMVFNESVNGGPVFGPSWWKGDAIVCGESRGKIWRTQLSKTPAGYVATTQLLACLQMLTVDACVAPNGDLVVACHSGPPDWGTGPTGKGKLYRIHMSNPAIARPANVWANSPREIQIAFDHPIEPGMLQGISDKIEIQYGEYVRAGDQFETLVPPYAVVQRQLMTPRKKLATHGISLSADRRNVLVQTDAMHVNTNYSLAIPYVSANSRPDRENAQHPSIELDYTLNGVAASLAKRSSDQETTLLWEGWLPHLDWKVSEDFTQQSATHEQLRTLIPAGGVLTLKTRLDLADILRPRVQPGSTLDYEWPQEHVTIVASASQPMVLTGATQQVVATIRGDGAYEARLEVPVSKAANFPFAIELTLEPNAVPDWTIGVSTNEDARVRALPLKRLYLPWTAEADTDADAGQESRIAELAEGNWGNGRRIFHSDAASCFKCHAFQEPGSSIGPDLSNLIHRDYKSVVRDIQDPSYSINPDYLGQVLLMKDDRILTGVLQTKAGQLFLGDAEGQLTRVDRQEIAAIKPSEVSVMPKGIHEKLTPDQMRDLLTYLMTVPPHMPLDSPLEAPPLRTRAEVAAVLAGSQPLPNPLEELRIVLVAGKKDHGPGEHDYPAWQVQWGQLLAAADKVTVEAAWDFPSDAQLKHADVLIFFQKGAWDDPRQQHMDAFLDRGGGAVYIHWAVNGDDRVEDFAERIGLASRGGSISYRHGPLRLQTHNTDHPIMRNVEPFQLYDESYWRLTGETQEVTLLASSVEDGAPQPQLWSYQRSAGRVFVSIPGHYNWTFDDPIFRTILLRGIAWTAKQPVDRFNELVMPGARMTR